MTASPDRLRAALLLTNRVVDVGAKPLTAREFWSIVEQRDPAELVGCSAADVAARLAVEEDEATRITTLLGAASALAFEEERLLDGGIQLVSALDGRFPARLRDRLGSACPPFLLVAGPVEWLNPPGLGVVGSRDAGPDAAEVARRAAERAVAEGMPVVSGLARGIDQIAMWAALDAGGAVVGVPAEGIQRSSRNGDVRQRVHSADLCIASPYAPGAPFRAGNAMGRNKIVYALSQLTLVVAADEGTGGTWAGAKESLSRSFAPVAVWTGEGAKDGNHALVGLGAAPVDSVDALFDIDLDAVPDRPPVPTAQPSLF